MSPVEASFPSSSTLRFRGCSCPSGHVWAVGKAGTLHPAHGPPHVLEISWLFLRELRSQLKTSNSRRRECSTPRLLSLASLRFTDVVLLQTVGKALDQQED